MNHANPNRTGEQARNVEVALRFKKKQGTPEMPQVEKEVLAPGYDRVRGGNLHLANNARDQGWPHPALYLRAAFPDRVDVMERVIADGDRVGLLFRVTGTQSGNFFGIEPTGRRVDVYEVALLRLVNGQMVEGWFMMDEAELLRQLGRPLPPRPDGRIVAPPIPQTAGAAEFLRSLEARPAATAEDRNRLAAAKTRLSPVAREGAGQVLRQGFEHLRGWCAARGMALDLDGAFPDRGYGIDVTLAEGDEVWLRFNLRGTHRGVFCGIAPTGREIGIHGVAIMTFRDGRWVDSWTFADELGLLLQLGQPNLLLG